MNLLGVRVRVLVLAAFASCVTARTDSVPPPAPPPPSLADWPNVLSVEGTWLFDKGSNFGYQAHQTQMAHGGMPLASWLSSRSRS